ncbi:SAM-dependent methyltransferase [Bremerella cremea]|uniref:SAM-dependent methyltransferase n=1 Tax=Blastopirellula marina TaxID=124 RepID=A0A2S8FIB7_9BACT|nr:MULTISPECIES: N-6 DNA methylase [Pirellulaceae]PQO31883.1 SAM-dependent methyltransferase [Blastopirellula marina]RCS44949.1 SAM-dependent methyltransferase [Bremerella cremea]
MIRVKSRQKTEFGDFQTPSELAAAVCHRLQADGVSPASVLEPTCGQGFFLEAAAHQFPEAKLLMGREWNADYVASASLRLDAASDRLDLAQADFFQEDWPQQIESLPGPVLILGNPPWVTNSELGSLGSGNLPTKSNFQNDRGIAAKTGKANFDISQWMITHLLESLASRGGTLAMLCKTAVARKILLQAWKASLPLGKCSIREINARKHFGAAVDACLLTCEVRLDKESQSCDVFSSLEATEPTTTLGHHEGNLLANRVQFDRYRHLLASQPGPRWRSGIKHDCRDVMQFRREGWSLVNGLGEVVELEADYLFPLMPAGAIFRGETDTQQMVLVPQSRTGEDTAKIEATAPRTWAYLQRHAARLAARKSSIYRGRPPYSIFGIGEYSFATWKVAISALHKSLAFRVIGPQDRRPVMLDDTTYFLSFRTRKAAQTAAKRLNSDEVRSFYEAWIFWDAKRPITSEILQRLA